MSVGNQSKRTDKSWPLERVSGCRIIFSNERLEKIRSTRFNAEVCERCQNPVDKD